MGNTLQNNPSDPTEGFVQPDWNSAAGEGVAPERDDSRDPSELYEAQREGAKERAKEQEQEQESDDSE